ncbi:hypothetical protein NMG60_11022113 [Bertholletia excelsa]
MGSPGNLHFLEINDNQFRLTEHRHRFPGRMIAGCDGVALFNDANDITAFFVANLATSEAIKLPCLESAPNPVYYSNCIARVPSTGQYKVVYAYEDLNREYHWLTLTVGVDTAWRKISCQQRYSRGNADLDNFPVSVGGMIYWTDYDFEVDGTIYFLAMDTDDETIHEVPIPNGSQEPCAYMKMGDYLSGFVTAPTSSQFEICILKDWRRGEWARLYQIDMEHCRHIPPDLFFYLPIGWLNDDEVLVLEGLTSEGDIYLAYDVKKSETRILDLSSCGIDLNAYAHTKTIVSWKKF